ncbi:uncharacterized protein [Physcomitrium patens]|uniref:BAT2 N-terminal domain-containing protein n=1 Tax=Physcomitrium patens TaxID=3218 RepID=A0A7I4E7U0_PHYPA|nr:uncharacterized protein LOC112284767 isoform X3 [Physcomitrium patens]|eukprot:XP_024380724.1 uncharacterized protein LOC112284767 isoform X3 [Physcomitrella patens]
MARAAGSNTKFASVNLNKSYGKPTAGAGGSGNGSGSGTGALGGAGRAGRTSSHGGMLLLSRSGVATSVPKGGRVIVPRPVNLPSLRREHAGNDPSIALVGGSGSSGWTKTLVHEEQAPVAVAVATPETSTGMARLAPALSAGSTWGTSPSLPGQPSTGSLSGEHWPVPTQSGPTGTTQVAPGRHGVYTPPRARAMQNPVVTSGHIVPAVEKAVVLRGEDFPTLQAALPPPSVSSHQRQKELHQKQREKQQELKDQQQKLQLLSEQHAVLKPDEVLQSHLGGPQLQPAQPISLQTKKDHSRKDAPEESQSLEQQRFTDPGLSVRSTPKAGNSSLGPGASGPSQQRQSNWTDDERDSTFRSQGANYSEWSDRSDREPDHQPANRVGEGYGYGRPPSFREVSFIPGRDGHMGKVADVRESRFSGDNSLGRESSSTAHSADNNFSRSNFTGREGGSREWGGGVNREFGFGGRGFSREGGRDVGSNKRGVYEKDGGDVRPGSRGWDGFEDRHGFGNRDQGPHRDVSSSRESGLNRENTFNRDHRRIQGGENDAGRGRFGGDRFPRNGASSDFFSGRSFTGQEPAAGRERRPYEGYHFNVSHGRSFEEIHGLDNFRPSQGVGIEPPVIPMFGFRRKKEEAKESDFRDEEREAFEAELERVQKAQELDRQRKLEEKEHAVEMAQKELEDRERLAREEEERQARLEEEAKEAAARAEREAMEAAQKVEDERKAREEEKRQLQLEEERRKENARRKLLELEERIAKREAEKKQQDEARLNVEDKPANAWQRGEEELRPRDDDDNVEEEKMVANVTGNAHGDTDRTSLRPSVAIPYSQESQKALQNENTLFVKPSEMQAPSAGSSARAELRGSNSASETERKTFGHWRREQPSENVVGSAAQMCPPFGGNESTDFQASVSRDRVYNGRGYGDRGESYYGGAPSSAGLSSDGGPGEFSRRSPFNDQRWLTEEPGFFNKQMNFNRVSNSDFESGPLEGSEDRDDRRWGRDRMERWRPGREGYSQRPSPPQTPPHFQGLDSTEPSSYGRLRHSLSKQPRVPPPPARMGIFRPPPKSSSEQTFVASSEAKDDDTRGVLPRRELDNNFGFSGHENNDEQHAKESSGKTTAADLQQENASQQRSNAWSSTQRGWQINTTSSLTPQCPFAQVSQGLSHDNLNSQPFSPSQEKSENKQNGDSPFSSLSQSEDDYEQKGSIDTLVISEVDKQEMHVQFEDLNDDLEDVASPTDDEEDEDEDEDHEGDEEGYEAYEGYDEDEDEDEDNDEDDELDGVDGGVGEAVDQGSDRTEIALGDVKDEHFIAQIIEDEGDKFDDANIEQDAAGELANSAHVQMTEDVGSGYLPQEEAEQTSLIPSVTGLVEVSDSCDVRQGFSQQLQPPPPLMEFSTSQNNDTTISSSVGLSGLHHSSEVPMTLQFGLLPGTSFLQGSVPAIQIGSIQMPLHVPLHTGLQQFPNSSSTAPPIQFGQLANPPTVLQSTFVSSQSNVSRKVQEKISEPESVSKVVNELQDTVTVTALIQAQPEKEPISLQPQSPWINQFSSVDHKSPVEVETKETRSTIGKLGQRSERRVRDRGMIREGPTSTIGPETYPRLKNSRRDPGNQRLHQDYTASQGLSTGMGASSASYDGTALRPRSNRRSNFRRTDLKSRDSAELLSEAAGGKFSKQTMNASTENLMAGTNGKDGFRDANLHPQESTCSGDNSRNSRPMFEGASSSKSDRASTTDVLKKSGGKLSGSSDSVSHSVEGLLGKHASELTSDAPLQSGVVHVFKQPGIERGDEDDFIEVRSKRQMLSDRRAEREKEIKAKSNLKAKEQAARKQRGSAKSGLQMEGVSGQGNKPGGFLDKRASNNSTENSGTTTRTLQPGGTTSTVASGTAVATSSQGLTLAPIGTPSGGLSDIRANASKSSRSNSVSGGSLVDSELGAAAATSDSLNQHQESSSGTPIAWGGTHSTRQVVSLTQIQLEEAMKPARYEAIVSQQLPLEARGSMVLDPGTTVASMAGKDKFSVPTAGPIGSLLAGGKIQFGAVTSPPLGVSNSRPHTPAVMNVVGSSLGSHADDASDKNDLKKPNHMSSSELDMPSFPTKGKRTRGQEDIAGSTDEGIDAEAEAEAAASAVAVAAISSDESVCSTREPIAIRKNTIKSSFGSVTSSTNHTGLGNSVSAHMQNPMMEDSMAAALPADLSVEPTSISMRGSPGQGSSCLSTSGKSSFSGLEMSQMLSYSFGPSKDVAVMQGSNDQGVPSASPSASGWQPQHSSVDSFYGGPPPSGFPGQYINPGAGMPPHMLVYTNPFSPVGQFGQLGFMNPTYLPSGKQPDWKHTPVWSSGPGVVGMSSNDSLGGMAAAQRGSGNIQRIAPGPALVPVVQSPGPFDLNLSAPFQIPNVDSSTGWSHVPGPMHVPISLGYLQQGRRGPSHSMEKDGGFNLGLASNQANNGNYTSMDTAAQFPDELGLGDTSSVPNITSPYGSSQNLGRSAINNQATSMSSSAQSNAKFRSNRRSSRVTRGGNLMSTGNGTNTGSVNLGMGVNSGGYNNAGTNGGRVPQNHLQPQPPHHLYPAMGGVGQPHAHHTINHSDQRGPSQQNSPRVGSSNWSGSQGHRKGVGNQGRPPAGERGSTGEKMFAPPSKLKQVYVAKPSSSPRRSSGETAIFNGTGGQAAGGL